MKSTDTVKNFFGLHKMPFSKLIGVNELYHSSSFKEAYARLQMGLENEDVVLLSGAVGSGKSNVLRYFSQSLESPFGYLADLEGVGGYVDAAVGVGIQGLREIAQYVGFPASHRPA